MLVWVIAKMIGQERRKLLFEVLADLLFAGKSTGKSTGKGVFQKLLPPSPTITV